MSQSAVADIRRQDFSPFESAIELFSYFSAASRSRAACVFAFFHMVDMDTTPQDATRASFPIEIF